MKSRLVSYDIWDTVFRRKCHPDIVKIHTANELISMCADAIPFHLRDASVLLTFRQMVERDLGQESRKSGLDDEYALEDVLKLWISRVCKNEAVDVDNLSEKLLLSEVDFECRTISADEDIIKTFQEDGASRRIYISDFYISKMYLDRLISKVGLEEFFNGGYVSCDIRLNKRSGRLFDYVRKIENVTEITEWHHYGDNIHSDVAMPKVRGIVPHHYLPTKQHARRLRIEKAFEDRSGQVTSLVREIFASPGTTAELALPLIVGFILYIQEEIRHKGLEHVYFFTREGEFFVQVYEAVRASSPYFNQLPKGDILEVSRLATFSPSLSEFSVSEMMRIWNLYSIQSLSSLFKTLNFDSSLFQDAIAKHGLDYQEAIKWPWQDARVQAFFNDPVVQANASEQIEKRKADAIAYFSKKMPKNCHSVAIVDIGWRGTIQDNLATLMPAFHFHGIYLGLNKFLNPQPKNVSKTAYGPDLNQTATDQHLLDFVAPLEMLCNSPNGSVVSYDGFAKGQPIKRDIDHSENAVYEIFTKKFQRTVLDSIPKLVPHLFENAVDSRAIRHMALSAWHQVITKPTHEVLESYFRLSHNETFGVGHYVSKVDKIPNFWLLTKLLTKSGRRKARSRISALGWIDGYLIWRANTFHTKLVRLLYPIKK